MSNRTSVHDLKSLVLSFHSLIAIETVEEERVRMLLQATLFEAYHRPALPLGIDLRRAEAKTHAAFSC